MNYLLAASKETTWQDVCIYAVAAIVSLGTIYFMGRD